MDTRPIIKCGACGELSLATAKDFARIHVEDKAMWVCEDCWIPTYELLGESRTLEYFSSLLILKTAKSKQNGSKS